MCCHALEYIRQFSNNLFDSLQHFCTDHFTEFVGARLDAEQFQVAAEFQVQVFCQHRERHRMGGGAQAVQIFHVDPADRSRRFVQLRGVDQEDDLGSETAQYRGGVLGGMPCVPNADEVQVPHEAGLPQLARHQDPGRVVRTEGVSDPEDGDLWETSGLGFQQLAERVFPGTRRRLLLFHSKR